MTLTLVFVLVLSGSCSDSISDNFSVEKYSHVYLRDLHRNYLSIDWPAGGNLIAKAKSPSQWDGFYIQKHPDGSVTIQNVDKLFLECKSGDSTIHAANSEKRLAIHFYIDTLTNGRLILKDKLGRMLEPDTNGSIVFSTHSENPHSFIAIPVQHHGKEQFTFNQLLPLIGGALCLILSIISFHRSKKKWPTVLTLFAGVLLIRIFAVMLNEYLFVWDEQFHALVAKNMMDFPFRPMLFANPLLPINPQDWSVSHIWLHKQPLFMWQMALSMKVFGVNVFALRLHGIITSLAITFMIWNIGKKILNNTAGFYGAILFALSYFSSELVAGACHTEHNDSAFLFYVCASVWSWIQFEHTHIKKKWVFLVLSGCLAGCAVLVKWLPGLLVFAGWGMSILLIPERRKVVKNYMNLMLAFIIACIVFLPWQLYILNCFPEESKIEFAHTRSHFTEAVEGHGGDLLYHFNVAKEIYLLPFALLLVSVVIMIVQIKERFWKIAITTLIITVYLFYTLAATKMPAFTFMISFLMFLALGNALNNIAIFALRFTRLKKHFLGIFGGLLLLSLGFVTFGYSHFRENHTMWRQDPFTFTAIRQRTIPVIKSLDHILQQPEKTVVFNCRNNDDIQIMFFSKVPASYCIVPSKQVVDSLLSEGYQVAVFNNDELPEFLWHDPRLIILEGYWH